MMFPLRRAELHRQIAILNENIQWGCRDRQMLNEVILRKQGVIDDLRRDKEALKADFAALQADSRDGFTKVHGVMNGRWSSSGGQWRPMESTPGVGLLHMDFARAELHYLRTLAQKTFVNQEIGGSDG
jgi:hypothetical protein